MDQTETSLISKHRDQPLFERYRVKMDSNLKSFVNENAGFASTMLNYHLGFTSKEGIQENERSEGKALRSTLCLLTVDALNGKWEEAIPAAVALELFHNFTLIHDDIQDDDHIRRGRPTVWHVWGKGQAINAGDAAAYVSSLALLQLSKQGYSSQKVLDTASMLFQTGIRVINGQFLDISFEQDRHITIASYFNMISNKTGALIEAAVLLGADLADANTATKQRLKTFAQAIGKAFQISDDILGIWGDGKETGKSIGLDVMKRKQSLPILLAFATATDQQEKQLTTLYNQRKEMLNDQDIKAVLLILDELDIKAKVESELAQVYNEAVQAIKKANLGWAEKDFLLIAKAMTFRKT